VRERVRAAIRGAVQGVGFRPFVHRLASELGLDGWVLNSPQGVFVEVEGERQTLERFLLRLERDRPPRAVIQSLEATWLDPVPHRGFEIRPSAAAGSTTALVLPDIATCDDCRREVFDASDRRYRYPFTNCTNCGPRYSILETLPYDRPNTSMRAFAMCAACRREYEDPADRRFHAQPTACPACGPQLALWDAAGEVQATRDQALTGAAGAILAGQVVAVKGLGGFHLVVDARADDAVRRLRARKHREEKPLALMYATLADVEAACDVSPAEARLLASPESPIVLLRRRNGAPHEPSRLVAPGNPSLGAMLPSTPLHHLMLCEVEGPIVATSGNRSDEPICTDEREALERLRGIADVFLVHDRPIVRHVDDSIARVVAGRELVVRRARGYAPLPVSLGRELPPVLAVGAHLKNTVAVAAGADVFVSQHIGDLETSQSTKPFLEAIGSLCRLHGVAPCLVAADLHPDYRSTKHARSLGLPVVHVQHHVAHVAACMAENELDGRVLGVAWDGTGYGLDGTVWGGEFLLADAASFARVAALRPFRLPGGEAAVREPRRSALGLLHALGADEVADGVPVLAPSFTRAEWTVLWRALERGVNSPITTSAGRLFDGVAALAGVCARATFEGQAAMALEFAVEEGVGESYPFAVGEGRTSPAPGPWTPPALVLDWGPVIRAVVRDVRTAVAPGVIAARFHNALVEAIVAVAVRVGEPRVVLTGGCFQNRYLTERAIARLRAVGFRPYWHQRVPPNDGGISLGQVAAVAGLDSRAARPLTNRQRSGLVGTGSDATCVSRFRARS